MTILLICGVPNLPPKLVLAGSQTPEQRSGNATQPGPMLRWCTALHFTPAVVSPHSAQYQISYAYSDTNSNWQAFLKTKSLDGARDTDQAVSQPQCKLSSSSDQQQQAAAAAAVTVLLPHQALIPPPPSRQPATTFSEAAPGNEGSGSVRRSLDLPEAAAQGAGAENHHGRARGCRGGSKGRRRSKSRARRICTSGA